MWGITTRLWAWHNEVHWCSSSDGCRARLNSTLEAVISADVGSDITTLWMESVLSHGAICEDSKLWGFRNRVKKAVEEMSFCTVCWLCIKPKHLRCKVSESITSAPELLTLLISWQKMREFCEQSCQQEAMPVRKNWFGKNFLPPRLPSLL